MQSQPTTCWQPGRGPRQSTVRSNVLLGCSDFDTLLPVCFRHIAWPPSVTLEHHLAIPQEHDEPGCDPFAQPVNRRLIAHDALGRKALVPQCQKVPHARMFETDKLSARLHGFANGGR